MTSTPSARLSATWPVSADALASDASASDASAAVTLTANAPVGAMSLLCDSFRVMSAFAFGKRATRQSSAAMCELMDRMN